ncbi:MAG: RHS repeat-associated core domain-containing protein [Bacteroidia bacterium]|nr:RHS repeat-associated core domain-containing protein [Bacteroidia bacterium]
MFEYNLTDHLGNVRVTFGGHSSGGPEVLQVTDYDPFGLVMAQQNFVAAENSLQNKYLYNGKELQDDVLGGTALDWYDYGARMYDPMIGRFTTNDPHAENYYSWSTYHYAANNPIAMIDPDGRDWYQNKDGNTMWQKGSAAVEGYKNLGATHTQNIGQGVSVGYTQNEATSMTFTGIDKSNFIAQGKGNCKDASDNMLAKERVNSKGERINVVNADNNGVATTANSNASKGIKAVDKALENGNPIEVGVDYKPVQVDNCLEDKFDGMTDHFVVVSSKTETLNNGQVTSKTYNFFDPRNSQFGTSPTNSLQISNNKLVGYYLRGTNKNIPYTVTTVRGSR